MGKTNSEKWNLNTTRVTRTEDESDNYYAILNVEKKDRESNLYKYILFAILILLFITGSVLVIVTLVGMKDPKDPDGVDFNMFKIKNTEVRIISISS